MEFDNTDPIASLITILVMIIDYLKLKSIFFYKTVKWKSILVYDFD
jgi:hypothetical protein